MTVISGVVRANCDEGDEKEEQRKREAKGVAHLIFLRIGSNVVNITRDRGVSNDFLIKGGR